MSTIRNKSKAALSFLAIVAIVMLVTYCVNRVVGDNTPHTLEGTWVSTQDEPSLTATIQPNEVSIMWTAGSTTSLYWQGTFPSSGQAVDGTTIVSVGDKEALSKSLLGSLGETKEFTYKDGKLQFSLTVLGVAQTIRLER